MRQLVIIGIAMFSCQLSFSQLQKGVPVVASKDAAKVSTKIHFFRLEEIQDAVIAAQTKVVLTVLKNTHLYGLSTWGGKQYKLIIK